MLRGSKRDPRNATRATRPWSWRRAKTRLARNVAPPSAPRSREPERGARRDRRRARSRTCGMRACAAMLVAMTIGFAMPASPRTARDSPLDAAWLDRAWDFDRPAESEARFRAKLAAL